MACNEDKDFSPIAIEHAQNPRNNTPLANFNGHAIITGPCGDTMEFWILVQNGKIDKVSFITDGCGSSLACGSMTTCLAESRNIEDAVNMQQQDIIKALGGLPKESEHCALLSANTLKAACENYLSNQKQKVQEQSKGSHCDHCDKKECSASQPKPGESEKEFKERQMLQSRLCRIRYKILVMSGKGGVGKSTVAGNLAVALMMAGKHVGLLDVDIHGPSIPTMLGIEGQALQADENGLIPIVVNGIKVMSLGLLLRSQDEAVIWRGPIKMGVIKQFLMEVAWGDLDFLVIDSPPGTGDEPLSVCQLIENMDGAVIVTTPQRVASVNVRKSINFCKQLNVPVIGVIENMSGFVCPRCGEVTSIFLADGGRHMAEDMGVPFLGSIPMDMNIAKSGDDGVPFIASHPDSPAAKIMKNLIEPLLEEMDKITSKNEKAKP